MICLLLGKSHNLSDKDIAKISRADEDEVVKLEDYLRHFHEKEVAERNRKVAKRQQRSLA